MSGQNGHISKHEAMEALKHEPATVAYVINCCREVSAHCMAMETLLIQKGIVTREEVSEQIVVAHAELDQAIAKTFDAKADELFGDGD